MNLMLIWNVKSSLLRYVESAENGGVRLDGVTRTPRGFAFTVLETSGPPSDTHGHLQCSGRISLIGHFGMPVQEIADPRLEWDPTGAQLAIADPPGSTRRLTAWSFARLTSDADGWRADQARLTPAGGLLFGGQYPAGTEFDSLHIERFSHTE